MTRNLSREEADRIIAYNNPIKFFLMGICGGILIGGILGVLYAPKKGSETREYIRNKAQDTAQMLRNQAEDIRDRAADVAQDIRGKAAETRLRGEQELRSVKEGP